MVLRKHPMYDGATVTLEKVIDYPAQGIKIEDYKVNNANFRLYVVRASKKVTQIVPSESPAFWFDRYGYGIGDSDLAHDGLGIGTVAEQRAALAGRKTKGLRKYGYVAANPVLARILRQYENKGKYDAVNFMLIQPKAKKTVKRK